jgi:hypothetical protein
MLKINKYFYFTFTERTKVERYSFKTITIIINSKIKTETLSFFVNNTNTISV